MNSRLKLCIAALAIVVTAPTLAGTATLTKRESVNHIALTSGNGPTSVKFVDGSLTPLNDLAPASIVVADTDSGSDVYGGGLYSTIFNATWDQRQDYSFQTLGSDAVLRASGSLLVSMDSSGNNNAGPIQPSYYYQSKNWQAFEFVLDEATTFSFEGATTTDQNLQMFRWQNNGWTSAANVISPGNGANIANSGAIAAGHYLLRNTPNTLLRIETNVTSNAWDYSLTLHNTVSAVPEPSTMASMLAGLSLIGWCLRRRSRR